MRGLPTLVARVQLPEMLYSTFGVGVCFVEETQCTSEQEFLQLVKRFMEN